MPHRDADSGLNADAGQLVIVRPDQAPEAWETFVASHPAASVFHSAAMLRAFDRSPGHESLAVGAADANGQLHAMIAPVRVGLLTPRLKQSPLGRYTSRIIMFGEPLHHDTPLSIAGMNLLLQHLDDTAKRAALVTEVRSLRTPIRTCPVLASHGYQTRRFLNYVIDLDQNQDALWSNIGKQMRGNINRSLRRGVKIESGFSDALLERAYAQVCRSHRRAMVPLPGLDLLHNVKSQLREVMQVRVATIGQRDIAGTISLAWGDRFLAWYGGTQRPAQIHPFACIVWDEVCWAKENGFRYYDFGGAGDPKHDYGPRVFKSRFHGELLDYGRCQKVHSPSMYWFALGGYRSLKWLLSQR